MRIYLSKRILAVGILALVGAMQGAVQGQVNRDFLQTGPADWNVGANWTGGFVPEATFNEVAVIGSNRSAFVIDTPPNPGGITITSGTLEIRNGGSLTAVPGPDPPPRASGNVVVGQGSAIGNLIVKRGGSFSAPSLTFGGATSSQLTLGEVGGTGTATLTVDSATLPRVTQITGPNVAFNSAGEISFSGGVLLPVITGAAHSTITAAGTATLSGTLRPQFSGYTPVFGNFWNLVMASSLTGNFTLDQSLLPAAPRGAEFYVSKTATTVALRYRNKLVLTVDRGTGAVSMQNVVGGPIAFDGYTIASPQGALGGTWNSFQDQALPSWDEADNSSNTRRTEFKTSGTTSLALNSSLSLGSPFAPAVPGAIGQAVGEDVTFQYSLPGEGIVSGIVEFVGRRNNVVLTIDPATGGAAIQNESPYFNVAIDAYTITSSSGKLRTGNANWQSLDDQNLSAWDEADNINNFRLTEFNPSGQTSLAGGGTVLNLGIPVDISSGALSASDFTFQVALTGGTILQGIVALGSLPSASLPGDYNHNGVVDAADYVVWRKTDGTPAGYNTWRTNFGRTIGSGTGNSVGFATVPEPTTTFSATLLLLGCLLTHRARWSIDGEQ